MSSTNKTSLGLNMWEASDKPVRQDFVNDNVTIDNKISEIISDLAKIGTIQNLNYASGSTVNSEDFQPASCTIADSGTYNIVMVQYANFPYDSDIFIKIFVNGVQLAGNKQRFSPSNYIHTLRCGKTIHLNKEDTITFKISNSSNVPLVTNNDGTISFAQVVRLK